MYRLLVNLLKYFRWLSLDIALGGAILFLFISRKVYHLNPSFYDVAALTAAILIIYTVDHLLDARRIPKPSMPRHSFHKKGLALWYLYLIFLLILGVYCISNLDAKVRNLGIVVSSFSVCYLWISLKLSRIGLKELLVALVYTTAMFVLPITQLQLYAYDYFSMFQLFSIALINLLIIAYYEQSFDKQDQTQSLAHLLGQNKIIIVIHILIAINLGSSAYLLLIQEGISYQLFIFLASFILIFVITFRDAFLKNEAYRWASDLIFFIPLFL